MRKISCLVLFIFAVCVVGCGQQQTASDANKIPTEVATTQTSEKPAEEQKPSEPAPPPEPVKNYVLAANDLSNLQLDDVTKPVYDRYTLWERQEKKLPFVLPEIKPYDAEPVAYLTFDDGPDDVITPQILDTLKAENVKATFYVCGNMVDTYPDVLKRIFDEDHAIGNHSYNHDYDELYSTPWAFMEQIIKTDNSIKNIIGMRPLIIRAPGGSNGMFRPDFYTMVADCGYVEHGWNALTEDATPSRPDAYQQVQNVLQDLGENPPRSVIVLMHSNGDKFETAKALPDIIHLLRDKGYKFGVVTPMTPQPW